MPPTCCWGPSTSAPSTRGLVVLCFCFRCCLRVGGILLGTFNNTPSTGGCGGYVLLFPLLSHCRRYLAEDLQQYTIDKGSGGYVLLFPLLSHCRRYLDGPSTATPSAGGLMFPLLSQGRRYLDGDLQQLHHRQGVWWFCAYVSLAVSGSEVAAAQQCPDVLLGTFDNYTIDTGSGAQCGGVGYLTVCDNHQNVTVYYSVCSEVMFYSCECKLSFFFVLFTRQTRSFFDACSIDYVQRLR